jgi:hypothetical protein
MTSSRHSGGDAHKESISIVIAAELLLDNEGHDMSLPLSRRYRETDMGRVKTNAISRSQRFANYQKDRIES